MTRRALRSVMPSRRPNFDGPRARAFFRHSSKSGTSTAHCLFPSFPKISITEISETHGLSWVRTLGREPSTSYLREVPVLRPRMKIGPCLTAGSYFHFPGPARLHPSDSPFRLRCAPLDQGGSAPWTQGRKGVALSASPLPRCAWTGGFAPCPPQTVGLLARRWHHTPRRSPWA